MRVKTVRLPVEKEGISLREEEIEIERFVEEHPQPGRWFTINGGIALIGWIFEGLPFVIFCVQDGRTYAIPARVYGDLCGFPPEGTIDSIMLKATFDKGTEDMKLLRMAHVQGLRPSQRHNPDVPITDVLPAAFCFLMR